MTKQRTEAPDVHPGLRVSRRIRFAIWVFAAVGALVFQALSHSALSIGCLVLIFLLLCSTPPSAIRLPRLVSELLILLATAVIDLRLPAWPLGIHLALLVLILVLLRLWGKSPWWAVLYGWFPFF